MKILSISQVERSVLGYTEIGKRVKASLPFPESSNGEYISMRIPGIIEAPDGSLVAYYECRTGGDWSAIDLCCRKSFDCGKTWSERQILVSGKGRSAMNNPVMIVCGEKVIFLYCEGYKRLFCRISLDSAQSFGEARELTDTVDKQMGNTFWSNLAVGPGHGIVTSKGRLIVTMWLAANRSDIYAHVPSFVTTLYSDDEGESWRLGNIIAHDDIDSPNESTLCELPDGRIMINSRNRATSKLRAVAYSANGGVDFTPMRLLDVLPDPRCMGSLCRAENDIFFVNCRSREGRENLTVSRIDSDSNVSESLLLSKLGGYADIFYSQKKKRLFALFEANDCTELSCAEIAIDI